MSTTESTRIFVEDLFGNLSTDGIGPKFFDSLSDNVVWTVTGSSPLAGVLRSKQEYLDMLKILGQKLDYSATVRPRLIQILADGDGASVHFHTGGAKTRSGKDFGQDYLWLLKIKDEKIAEVVGFFDSKMMSDLFAE